MVRHERLLAYLMPFIGLPKAIFGSFGWAGRNYAAARLRILTRL